MAGATMAPSPHGLTESTSSGGGVLPGLIFLFQLPGFGLACGYIRGILITVEDGNERQDDERDAEPAMRTPEQTRRMMVMRQRRRVKPRRRFYAISREGTVVIYGCQTCGWKDRQDHGSEAAAKLYRRYHSAANSGCSGDCKPCTKKARDKLYPLPPVKR